MAKEENKELHEFFGQMQEGEKMSQAELAAHAEAAKAATTGIALETPAETEARMREIAKRADEIKELVGKSALSGKFTDDDYVARRNRPNAPAAGVQNFGDNRPARAMGKGYYAGSVPTTAPKVEEKKGFFKTLFGGN